MRKVFICCLLLINVFTFGQSLVDAVSIDSPESYLSEFLGKDINGNDIYFEEEIYLLSFSYFACRPCMLEIPFLNEISMEYSGRINVIGIFPHMAEDLRIYQENNDTTSIFCRLRKRSLYKKIEYTIVPECEIKIDKAKNVIAPLCDSIRKNFNVQSYPTNILIDKKGYIRKVYNGFNAYEANNIFAKIKEDINILLNE